MHHFKLIEYGIDKKAYEHKKVGIDNFVLALMRQNIRKQINK